MSNIITDSGDDEMLSNMLMELQTLSKIAVLKEEGFVMRNIFVGKSRPWILEKLNKKHFEANITKKDLDEFLLLYKDELMLQKVNVEKGYVRRLIKSKEGLNNELIGLATTAKEMSTRYDEAKDYSNAVAALKTAADIFMKFAKVEGLANDQPEVTVNMKMDKIVQNIANEKVSSRLKDLEEDIIEGQFTEDGNEDNK